MLWMDVEFMDEMVFHNLRQVKSSVNTLALEDHQKEHKKELSFGHLVLRNVTVLCIVNSDRIVCILTIVI